MEYTIADYDRVIDKLPHVFSGIDGVVSIMQFGTINAPGNSDIDLIFVIQEDKNVRSKVLEAFANRFSEEEQYLIFQHEPFFLSERLIASINMIRPSNNIKPVFGKNFEIESKFGICHNLYVLVEIITNYYPCYLTAFSSNRINHQVVNAFGHTYDLYRSISNDFGLDISFASRLSNLLEDNDRIRKQSQLGTFEQEQFIKDAKAKVLQFVIKMCEELGIALKPFVRDNGVKTVRVYKGKIFSSKAGKCWQANVLGRNVNIMPYPLIFFYLFGEKDSLINQLKTAVKERNNVLREYSRFCMEILGGVYFYRPWWMQWKDSTRSRVKNATLNIISRVI